MDYFARFTEGAKNALACAAEYAKSMGHNYVGTEHLLVGIGDADVVHHLSKTLHAVVLVEGVDRAVIEHCAGFIERRRGHAGGEHETHVDGKILRRLQHILNTVGAHNVGDLVRVGDNGRGAVRNDSVGKFLG